MTGEYRQVLYRNQEHYPVEKQFEHRMGQYKLYVEMADRISSRRQSANSFFLTVNTALVALVSYVSLGAQQNGWYWIVALAGIALCYTWYRLIRSYKDLNTAKFKVIHEIEAKLPMAPYDAEWEAAGRGKDPKLYLPFTRVEMCVPWVFLILHAVVALQCIPWVKLITYVFAAIAR